MTPPLHHPAPLPTALDCFRRPSTAIALPLEPLDILDIFAQHAPVATLAAEVARMLNALSARIKTKLSPPPPPRPNPLATSH